MERPAMNTTTAKKRRRIILWSLVVVYTFSLPYVFVIYNFLILRYSYVVIAFLPRLMLLIGGTAYLLYFFKAGLPLRKIFFLPLCICISLLIIYLQPYPNKHIHIPEYILMAWLIFEAVRIDYRGAGIFLLVFLFSSSLGVLDEILQGIHPSRSYGWQDMLINSSSSLIGILSLIGLREDQEKGWDWIDRLRKMRVPLSVVLLGILSAAVSCYMLFEVKSRPGSWHAYPYWLFAWNVMLTVIILATLQVLYRRSSDTRRLQGKEVTAALWVLLPLVILLAIHLFVISGWVSGVVFQ